MKSKRQAITRVALVVVVVMLFSTSLLYAIGIHKPVFTWQYRGGSVNTEQWIYDGDSPLALFEHRVIEQPALQLMFFNSVRKPLLLRHIRLTPDGPPLVEAVQLYCKCGQIITDQLVDLDIAGQGTDRLVVTFVTGDREKTATSTRVLTLTYDSVKETYVYDFQVSLKFNSPELFNGKPPSVEYVDPWFVGCPGPAVEFPGMWKRRYQQFVYESQNGEVRSIPINHYTTSHKGGIKLKPDGIFLTAFEPDANPAIQMVGDTADKSNISICWWGYDFHLSRSITSDELFGPIQSHYRIFRCPSETAKSLLQKGVQPPLGEKEWDGEKEYPVYERVSSFDKGLRLDRSYQGAIDPFPWLYVGKGAEWDRTYGRTDSSSLKIARKEEGLTRWQTFQGDGFVVLSDQFYPGWRAYVDGRESPIYRANYLFRAVPVPAGEHVVEFTYQPVSVGLGPISRRAIMMPAQMTMSPSAMA